MRVAMVGDSNVLRLSSVPEWPKFSVSGAKAENFALQSKFRESLLYKPDIVFLLLGGNDISRTCTPLSIANNIRKIQDKYYQNGASRIYVFEIMPRTKPRGLHPDQFSRTKSGVNLRLRRKIREDLICLGGRAVFDTFLAEDGVHLNSEGQQQLMSSIADRVIPS